MELPGLTSRARTTPQGLSAGGAILGVGTPLGCQESGSGTLNKATITIIEDHYFVYKPTTKIFKSHHLIETLTNLVAISP